MIIKKHWLVTLLLGVLLFGFLIKPNNKTTLQNNNQQNNSNIPSKPKKQFAMYVEKTSGLKDWEEITEFPGPGYKLGYDTKCYDNNGTLIREAVEMNEDGSVTISTTGTSYCTLYFEIHGPKTCLYEGELVPGAVYEDGDYEYHYKEHVNFTTDLCPGSMITLCEVASWSSMEDDGWSILYTGALTRGGFDWSGGGGEGGALGDQPEEGPSVASLNEIETSVKEKIVGTSDICGTISGKPIVSMRNAYHGAKVNALDWRTLDASHVTDMSDMFTPSTDEYDGTRYASVNRVLGLENLDTLSVRNMSGMFYYARVPSEIISALSTNNVTNMDSMFLGYDEELIDLSHFETHNVTDMGSMFQDCTMSKFTGIDKLDTSSVVDMSSMFRGASVDEPLDLRSYDTGNVSTMFGMFESASVTSDSEVLFPEGFARSASSLERMFSGFFASSLDLSNLDTSSAVNLGAFLRWATVDDISFPDNFGDFAVDVGSAFLGLKSSSGSKPRLGNQSDVRFPVATSFRSTFSDTLLTNLDFPNLSLSQAEDVNNMFSDNKSELIDLSMYDASSWRDLGYLFSDAYATSISLPLNLGAGIDDDSSVRTTSIFQGLGRPIEVIGRSNPVNVTIGYPERLITTKFEHMKYTFAYSTLTPATFPNFDSSHVEDMDYMFYHNYASFLDLRNLDMSSIFVGSYVNGFEHMFEGASATAGYARGERELNYFNSSAASKPDTLTFTIP